MMFLEAPVGPVTKTSALCRRSGVPRPAAEDQEGAAQPVLGAELQLQPGAALQAPVWREVPLQRQVNFCKLCFGFPNDASLTKHRPTCTYSL